MDGVRLPDGATGRPGMVAQLQKLGTERDGRLVVLLEPAGYLATKVRSEQPVFSWRARLLGPMLQEQGRHLRDLFVPDRCLAPVSSMSDDELDVLTREQAHADFEDAMQDLGAMLDSTNMSAEDFNRAVDRAGEQFVIDRALEVVPVPVALREIGFIPPTADSSTLEWTGVHKGMELRFHAGMNLSFGWQIVASGRSTRAWVWDERNLLAEAPRGAAVALVLGMWRSAFGPGPVPDALSLGAVYEDHQRLLRRTGVTLPTLRPDPVAFRAIRKWMLQAMPMDLPEGEEKWLQLSQDGAMLRIELDGMPYGCPARGVWAEPREVRFSDFAALPASVSRARQLVLVQDGDSVRVNGWRLPSRALDPSAR